MNQKSRFSSNEENEHLANLGSSQTAAREFASAEEMLRLDAAQTQVPPEIAQRLAQSIKDSPPPRRPWWRKLFE